MKSSHPQHGTHREICQDGCHFHATQDSSAETRGKPRRETSMPPTQSQAGEDSSAAPKIGLCVYDKAGVFPVQSLKQTEDYKVHKKIFHAAEPCKVFTLEFLFLNSLSQDSIWFGKPGQLS